MTAALEGDEWSAARPGRTLSPGKARYPFYRRLGVPQSRSGRVENLVPTGIRFRTVQPVVSRYTDWVSGPTQFIVLYCCKIKIKPKVISNQTPFFPRCGTFQTRSVHTDWERHQKDGDISTLRGFIICNPLQTAWRRAIEEDKKNGICNKFVTKYANPKFW